MIICLTCVLISTLVSKTASLDFSLKGDPCSKFDSCFAKPHLRTCNCNDDCQLYGTCCQDFKKLHKDLPRNSYSCYSRHAVTPVFVKRSCSDDFRGHVDFKLACLDDDEDEMDVNNNLLVTSHKTKVTYWNQHCAKCSNEFAEDLEFWNIEVFCPQRKNVDRSLIRRNLTFDHDKKQWGLEVGGEFLRCIVKYAPPPYIDEVNKPCVEIISNCPDNYMDEATVMACSTYYGERKLKSGGVYYKNIHCAICNGVDVTNLECPGMNKPDDSIDDSDFIDLVQAVFTHSNWLDKEADEHFNCSQGYSFDPMRIKCRRDLTLSKENIPIPNSSNIYRTRNFAVLTILLVLLYSY